MNKQSLFFLVAGIMIGIVAVLVYQQISPKTTGIQKSSTPAASTASQDKDDKATTQAGGSNSLAKSSTNSSTDNLVITNIAGWNHRSKAVFQNNQIQLKKVELTKNRQYPIFHISGHVDEKIIDRNFLNALADSNGYWDFKIIGTTGFVEVVCDKSKKQVIKTVTDNKSAQLKTTQPSKTVLPPNQAATENNKQAGQFTQYNGKWYNTQYAKCEGCEHTLSLQFQSDGKTADIIIKNVKNKKTAEIKTKATFNSNGETNFSFSNDKWGNSGTGAIELHQGEVSIHLNVQRKKDSSFYWDDSGFFVSAKEIQLIEKSMSIVEKDCNCVNVKQGTIISQNGKPNSVYFSYEGKTLDGDYTIALRDAANSSVKVRYYVNPVIGKFTISN